MKERRNRRTKGMKPIQNADRRPYHLGICVTSKESIKIRHIFNLSWLFLIKLRNFHELTWQINYLSNVC